ncbi:MAG: LysR family transcriptional regulator [Microbacteriaceae bacterium]|nr:LysR family transcriptional regulator [Microbacteriaceae bacterium]
MATEPFTIAFVAGVTLTKWTAAWEARHPDAPLAFEPTAAATQLDAVRERRAQVAFVRLPVDATGLSVIPLYEETAVVVVPRDHALAVRDSVTVADVGDDFDILPQSIARSFARKDTVTRPVSDAEPTRIALAWRESATTEQIEEFIGIVRGRTANSSRGAQEAPAPEPKKKQLPPKPKQKVITGRTRPRKPRRR